MVLTESHEVVFSGHPSREDLTGDGGSASKLTHTVVGRRLHFFCKGVSLFGCSRLRLAVNSVNVGRQTDRKRERKTESEKGGGRDWRRNHWLLWPTSQSYTPSLLFTKFREREKSLSRVRLFATPWTVAHQAPPSMGFSRQEYWSGLPFPLKGIFPTEGSIPGLPHCREMLYHLSHQECSDFSKFTEGSSYVEPTPQKGLM